MRFHYIIDNNMVVSEIPFGKSLDPLNGTAEKAHYVTIEAKEFQDYSTWTEKQMLQYIAAIRRKILVGGKVYLEIANYQG